MKLLEEKIKTCGRVLPGGVLKVDGFLNHQIDVDLIMSLGREFFDLFRDEGINKILTVEASGISIAFAAAQFFHVPVVFAKKGENKNVGKDVYTGECFSFTKGKPYEMSVSKAYLGKEDSVLIIDDFLANGAAVKCLMHILDQAGASLVGVGIAIEKGFQPGGSELRAAGVRVESLARIRSMDDEGGIEFFD
ncbi:MAG: xanthine phosphoribosyltransferase [Clostridia bacterium]|nr:xanthine phosphoribosyltransferase [Clostridia bacterium]